MPGLSGRRVPTRSDLLLCWAQPHKPLVSGAPGQGHGSSQHSPRTHHTIERCLCSSPPLHPSLSRALWGVCLSTERGDCSIAEKMYKMLSPFFCWAIPSSAESTSCSESPLCSPLKMSTWIWSSCIANNYNRGLELRHARSHRIGRFAVHDWEHLTLFICRVQMCRGFQHSAPS